MIQTERIKILNQKVLAKGDYVLYWMQQSQRVLYNHALEYAIEQANLLNQPLVVFFGLTDDFPEANERHYTFMLQGLQEVKTDLEALGILLVIQSVSPEVGALQMARRASLAITDSGYLRIQRQWREYLAHHAECPVIQIESDVIVPVQTVSSKEEYAAATIRKKIYRYLDAFLLELTPGKTRISSLCLPFSQFPIENIGESLATLKVNRDVGKIDWLKGGTGQAISLLDRFISDKLEKLADCRNAPDKECISHLGPYLHFGQISSLYIALRILSIPSRGSEIFFEELCIRRELAMNFVFYNSQYDCFDCLPTWVKKTLDKHRIDKRPYIYSIEVLEAGQTHDPYWNAAQKELVFRGKMHGYMRMYWGKKVLEWSDSPERAYEALLYLNNKFSLDGRDANGFAGIAWCFGKHDRPWAEREIFGQVRYMNAQGLRRKFSMDDYLRRVNELIPAP